MKCPVCGCYNPDGATFCVECSNSFVAGYGGAKLFCPNCGNTGSGGSKFCTLCGALLVTEVDNRKLCPSCSREYEEGTKFCTSCGTPLPQSEEKSGFRTDEVDVSAGTPPATKKCFKCGAPIPETEKVCETCKAEMVKAPQSSTPAAKQEAASPASHPRLIQQKEVAKCSECGSILPEGSQSCSTCGVIFGPPTSSPGTMVVSTSDELDIKELVALKEKRDKDAKYNKFKTYALLGLQMLLFLIIGLPFGIPGIILALTIGCITNLIVWFYADTMILNMYKAKQVDEVSSPRLYKAVRALSTRADIPMPKVYVIPSNSPNAFATGRDPEHASVAVTHGLLTLLNQDELEAVLGHELAHVSNRDTLIAMIAAGVTAAVGVMTWIYYISAWINDFVSGCVGGIPGCLMQLFGWLFVIPIMILAPLLAGLIQMAISRTREYQADSDGAMISGKPGALASALIKISGAIQANPPKELASPNTAHLWISNPIAEGGCLFTMFSTHPPMQERVRRLQEMVTRR